MATFFLDTAYTIALSSVTDSYHQRALELAEQIETSQVRLITTRAVIVEIGNALSKPRYRRAAVALLESIEADPRVEIVSLTEDLYFQALNLFRARPDKKWGMTDCISFVVMHERGITDALTTDEDFEQVDYRTEHLCFSRNMPERLLARLVWQEQRHQKPFRNHPPFFEAVCQQPSPQLKQTQVAPVRAM